jgi:hypothetical protein
MRLFKTATSGRVDEPMTHARAMKIPSLWGGAMRCRL